MEVSGRVCHLRVRLPLCAWECGAQVGAGMVKGDGDVPPWTNSVTSVVRVRWAIRLSGHDWALDEWHGSVKVQGGGRLTACSFIMASIRESGSSVNILRYCSTTESGARRKNFFCSPSSVNSNFARKTGGNACLIKVKHARNALIKRDRISRTLAEFLARWCRQKRRRDRKRLFGMCSVGLYAGVESIDEIYACNDVSPLV